MRSDAGAAALVAAGAEVHRGTRYQTVAEEGVPFRDIAGAISRRLELPVLSKTSEEAADHFTWFTVFAGMDAPASSEQTRKLLAGSRRNRDLSTISTSRVISRCDPQTHLLRTGTFRRRQGGIEPGRIPDQTVRHCCCDGV